MVLKRMRFMSLGLIVLGLGLGVVAYFRLPIIFWLLTPGVEVGPLPMSNAPDYSKVESWVALPSMKDPGDFLAPGEKDAQVGATADVFFIHPTSYFGRKWNDPLDGSGEFIVQKERTIIGNGSVFNGSARVFIPVYRQAQIMSFVQGWAVNKPLNYAYSDVLRAFDYYLKHHNKGRPIFIAGHSQGSEHGLRLLRDRFSKQMLRNQLVAAYLAGRPIARDALGGYLEDIPVCQAALEVGCFVNWITFGAEGDFEPVYQEARVLTKQGYETQHTKDLVCVNPLSWKTDEVFVPQSQNLGSYEYHEEDGEMRLRDQNLGAGCKDGILLVEPTFPHNLVGHQNYHVYDYFFFYKNLRQNIGHRLAAWHGLQASTEVGSRL